MRTSVALGKAPVHPELPRDGAGDNAGDFAALLGNLDVNLAALALVLGVDVVVELVEDPLLAWQRKASLSAPQTRRRTRSAFGRMLTIICLLLPATRQPHRRKLKSGGMVRLVSAGHGKAAAE